MSGREKSAELAWLHGSSVSAAITIEGMGSRAESRGFAVFLRPTLRWPRHSPWLHGTETEMDLLDARRLLPELVHSAPILQARTSRFYMKRSWRAFTPRNLKKWFLSSVKSSNLPGRSTRRDVCPGHFARA